MRSQTLFYQRLIGRTAVRPYTRNLGQSTFETLSHALGYFMAPLWGSGHEPKVKGGTINDLATDVMDEEG